MKLNFKLINFLLPILPAFIATVESFPPEIYAAGPLMWTGFSIPWFLFHYLTQFILANLVYWIWDTIGNDSHRLPILGLIVIISVAVGSLIAYLIPAELPLSVLRPFTQPSLTLYIYTFEGLSLGLTGLALFFPAKDFIRTLR